MELLSCITYLGLISPTNACMLGKAILSNEIIMMVTSRVFLESRAQFVWIRASDSCRIFLMDSFLLESYHLGRPMQLRVPTRFEIKVFLLEFFFQSSKLSLF